MPTRLLCLAALFCCFTQCQPAPADDAAAAAAAPDTLSSGPPIILLTQPLPEDEGPREVMQALVFGRLVLENGCLRVQPAEGEGEPYTIVWPGGYQVRQQGERIDILNESQEDVASVGDLISMDGGEVSNYQGENAGRCPGKYWITGNEVRRQGE